MKRFYNFLLKLSLLSLFIGFNTWAGFSAIYYVSNTGNDSNTGLSAESAWKTLAKVNQMGQNPGDQVLFERGGVYTGLLNVGQSGTAGSPITFGAYGSGENPKLSGFATLSSWTSAGNGIYYATLDASRLNLVTLDGAVKAMGRFPETGYFSYESHSGYQSITDNQLTGAPNWTGAEIAVRKYRWIIDRHTVTSHSGGTLTFSSNMDYGNAAMYEPLNNNGYFIQNHIGCLNDLGDWSFNAAEKRVYMYFGSGGPAGHTVKASYYYRNVSLIDHSYINFSNINFEGANIDGIHISGSSNINFSGCDFTFQGGNALYSMYSSYINITGGTIANALNDGIFFEVNVNNVTVDGLTITNAGHIAGASKSGDGASIGLFISGNNTIVRNCKVTNTGYNAIHFDGDDALVENNTVNTFCTLKDDGGGIYTYIGQRATIRNNVVLNAIGAYAGAEWGYWEPFGKAAGIYLDNGSASHNATLSGNSLAHGEWAGIFINDNGGNSLLNNTVFDFAEQLLVIQYNAGRVRNTTVTGNQFIAKSSTQKTLFNQMWVNESPSLLGTFNNNYYARPIDDNQTIQTSTDGNTHIQRTLEGWKSYSGQDANSQKSPQSVTNESDLRFEYNATKTARTISLPVPMIDVKGTKYSSSVTLQPFTSIVLIKDASPAAATVPGAPTSVVATAGDASATVTFAIPTSNGGSAITGYTVTSIPAGGIDLNAGSTSLSHTISGLTNGTSYTFTVKATNSAGSSVASAPSNAVIPKSAVAVASTFTFTGPSLGNVNSASSNFTVTPNNLFTGTITITPSGTGSAGLSSKVLTFTNSSTAQSFTITPTVAGSITLTATNNGGLTNPAPLNYTALAVAPGAPTSVVATAGDASATVTFATPTSNGGSAITGYTVTSIPAGGIDLNAGSTSLSHTISGLTNGTSYTFTVKATNSAGSSVASAPSNAVVPGLPKDLIPPIVTDFSIPSYANSVTVPIITFTASDNIGVTGYLITESSSAPAPGASGWKALVPSVYVFSSPGSKTLYAWTKDEAGNVSASRSDQVKVTKGNRLKNGNNLEGEQVQDYMSEQMNEQFGQMEVFPNPTVGRITVRFSTQPAEGSRIDILDVSGRTVVSRVITGMVEEFNLDQQAPGVYMVKSIQGSEERFQKLIITK